VGDGTSPELHGPTVGQARLRSHFVVDSELAGTTSYHICMSQVKSDRKPVALALWSLQEYLG
jgi:hypothetical protein